MSGVVRDFRAVLRKEDKVKQSGMDTHRRVFVTAIEPDGIQVYISCYIEAANRDAFLAVQEGLLYRFSEAMRANGCRFAFPRHVVALATDPLLPAPSPAAPALPSPPLNGG